MKFFFATLIAAVLLSKLPCVAGQLVLSCSQQNDLFRTLSSSGQHLQRCATPAEAVAKAKENSTVLILADAYPEKSTPLDSAFYEAAARKHLRLYVEYPSNLPGYDIGAPRSTTWERAVVASDSFGTALPKMKILTVQSCRFLPIKETRALLAIARIAGFDTAVYGLPKDALPLLFEIPEKNILVATTRLSDFVHARYAPTKDWQTLWKLILDRIDPDHAPHRIESRPLVQPAFAADEKLPRDFERRALKKASDWIVHSRLLVPSWRRLEIEQAALAGQEEGSMPGLEVPNGDGTLGILEGYASGILPDGSQRQRLPVRADCNTESAMVLATSTLVQGDKSKRQIAENLLDFVYFNSGMCKGARGNPKHSAYGMISWGDISPTWMVANYGDDNARTLLATILAARAMNSEKWNEPIAKGLLANFRTTGKLGFRGDRIDIPQLDQHDWKYFYNSEVVNYSPHFESGLWACYLWAFQQTQYRPLLEKTRNAIGMTMKVYPTGWRWNDQVERARMLPCLAWLVRVDDTPEHRQWLMTVANDLLKQQQPNGAIHEWLGGTGGGHYHIPQSNEAYGTGETPLIQKNGDPASDQLYTTGFALFGLHEAVAATRDAKLKLAEDQLAEFLCRIQVHSTEFPFVDGWWFRAFDDRAWEYWASSADIGWGAWSLEAGWAQAWTAATLALREKKISFWDFTQQTTIARDFETWKKRMLETHAGN